MSAIVMISNTSTSNPSQCTKPTSQDYEADRRDFIHQMYNHNPSNAESHNLPSSMISLSYTDNAADDSCICNSPVDRHPSDSPLPIHNIPFSFVEEAESKLFKPDPVPQPTVAASPSLEEKASMERQRHQSNITQKKDIIPPKKMKKEATVEELQMVLDHLKIAQNKDIEAILAKNEPHVLYYRDKLYLEAQQNGITQHSGDLIRLKILAAIVEYAFMNIEPPNEYTKQTDRKHFKEVGAWAAKFAKDKGVIPSLVLIYSAWCHDIERFIPSTKCEYLPESVDKYRKQMIHGVTSAKVACCLLKGAPVSQEEKERIYEIIMHHDMPNPREDIVILNRTLVSGISEDLMDELALLMDADSFAFFQSTIYYFILFKSKKNSPDWIWERVKVNLKRLRPYLRDRASQAVHKLPMDVRSKMAINYEELAGFCAQCPPPSPSPSEMKKEADAKEEEIQENIDFLSADHVQISNLQMTDAKETGIDSEDSQKSDDL